MNEHLIDYFENPDRFPSGPRDHAGWAGYAQLTQPGALLLALVHSPGDATKHPAAACAEKSRAKADRRVSFQV